MKATDTKWLCFIVEVTATTRLDIVFFQAKLLLSHLVQGCTRCSNACGAHDLCFFQVLRIVWHVYIVYWRCKLNTSEHTGTKFILAKPCHGRPIIPLAVLPTSIQGVGFHVFSDGFRPSNTHNVHSRLADALRPELWWSVWWGPGKKVQNQCQVRNMKWTEIQVRQQAFLHQIYSLNLAHLFSFIQLAK